jgi:GMP synthase (glutamine-hydrolysing)
MRVLAAVHSHDGLPFVFGDVVRELGHELVEWRPPDGPAPGGADAAIVLGGAMHVDQEDAHPWLRDEKRWIDRLLADETPVLGVCLGAELLALGAGWPVVRLPVPEIGWHEAQLTAGGLADPLLGGVPSRFPAFQWHSYAADPPAGGAVLAAGASCAQAYRVGERAWGIQFHAEVNRAAVELWLDGGSHREDARAAELDLGAVRDRTAREIGGWNELGRGLCARFLDLAAAA